LICPNCKTELVEVNGRYICSDCGREIPENEVMASDWGNGGNTRAGLYGAGTDEAPEVGSNPITDYGSSLAETANTIETALPTPEPVPAAVVDESSVEEILQEQVTSGTPGAGFYTPEMVKAQPTESETPVVLPITNPEVTIPEVTIPIAASEPTESVSVAPTVEPEIVPMTDLASEPAVQDIVPANFPEPTEPIPAPLVTNEAPMTMSDILTPPAQVTVETVIPTEPEVVTPEPVESIPVVTAPIPEVPVEAAVTPETQEAPTPAVEQVVTDMFESSEVPTVPLANDPGIYTDPMYDNNQPTQAVSPVAASSAPMPADKRTTLAILIGGVALILLLIIGGAWAYLSLNKVSQPTVTPVVDEVAWQVLQVLDGGYKISFPGTPEKAEATALVDGVEGSVTSHTTTSDDIIYTSVYATLTAAQSQAIVASPQNTLPTLVEELATNIGLTAEVVKVGKYYTADAIDFTLSSDTASYQGKLMVRGDKYIYVLAGSTSGQTVDYDKFIKSFSFITSGTTE